MTDRLNRPITYGFGNIGRDTGPGSTRRMDLEALRRLKSAMPKTRAVVFLCEINEGDDDNELALVRETFRDWHLYGGNTHEPILLSPDMPRATARTLWVPDTAVKHWSPQRSLLEVNLTDEPITLLGMHYPAGAHGQGDRPDWAKPLLDQSWDNCRRAHKTRMHAIYTRGRNIVWMMDVNNYDLPLYGPPHGEHERPVVHEHTDYGRVLAGPHHHPQFTGLDPVDLHIDSHDGQRMRGRFTVR